MSYKFQTAVKTLDQCISIAGEDVLSYYCRKLRTWLGHKWNKKLQKAFLSLFSKVYISYSRTPLYGSRSNQNLYLFLIKLLLSRVHPAKRYQYNALSLIKAKAQDKMTSRNDVLTRSF